MKHHEPNPMHDAELEQAARLAWEARQQLIDKIKQDLLSLPLEARLEVFKDFCKWCGFADRSCECWDL